MRLPGVLECIEVAERFAADLPMVDGRVPVPPLSGDVIDACMGRPTEFNERRAFEWTVLNIAHRREGDDATASYCSARAHALRSRPV